MFNLIIGIFIGFIACFIIIKTSMNGAQGNLKICKNCPYVVHPDCSIDYEKSSKDS